MKRTNWILFGVGLGFAAALFLMAANNDIARGQQGYDSVYYRHYTPYTSPMATEAGLAQVRNLPISQSAWVRSGAGCEYLIEHAYDDSWKHAPLHLARVLEARSRWGLPCHEASWWRSGSVIAHGDEPCEGQWGARREKHGGGWRLKWTCQREDRR